jgi:hypothetical protein
MVDTSLSPIAPQHSYFPARLSLWLLAVNLSSHCRSPFHVKIITEDVGMIYHWVEMVFGSKAGVVPGGASGEMLGWVLMAWPVVVCLD